MSWWKTLNLSDSPWTFWRRPLRLYGFVLRSRWWWGRPHRSFPGKWWSSLGLCRTTWRRWPFPSDPVWSPPPWCCRQNRGRRRIQHLLPQYSDMQYFALDYCRNEEQLLNIHKCLSLYLQSSTQLHCVTLLDNTDAEVGSLKQLFEDHAVCLSFGSCIKKQTEGHSVSLVNLQSPSACRQHQWTSTYFSFADNKWKSISLSPMVVSQNFSSATSLAMLAPIRTLTSIASFSRMMSEMSFSPSGPSSIPWMTTIRRRGMYLVPSGLEVMDSLCSPTTSCDVVATEQYEALWSDGTLPHLTWRTAILLWWVISRWFPPWRELSSGHRCCRWIDEGSQTPGSLLLWRPLWHLEQPPDEVSTAELVLRTASDHREPKRVYKQFKHSDLPQH